LQYRVRPACTECLATVGREDYNSGGLEATYHRVFSDEFPDTFIFSLKKESQ
jgi:hypothetical protein